MRVLVIVCLCIVMAHSDLFGATVNVRFINPVVEGSNFHIDVEVKAASADLLIGGSTIFMEYNKAAISSPIATGIFLSENKICDGDNSSQYETSFRYLESGPKGEGNYAILMDLMGSACPTITNDTWVKVASFSFQVENASLPTDLVISTNHSRFNSFTNTGVNQHTIGTVSNFDLSVLDVAAQTTDYDLTIKAYLKGALEGNGGGTLMRDDLRTNNLIPNTEPYSAMPGFDIIGTAGNNVIDSGVLNTTGSNAIVDWVLVELRDSNNPKEIFKSQAALLQRDGDIVGMDGVSKPTFKLFHNSYYVSVRHRNHLGVMTSTALNLSNANINFTSTTTPTWGINAQNVANGVSSLWSGNSNGDDRVILQGANNDTNGIFFAVLTSPLNAGNTANFILTDYNNNDINLDGQTIFQGLVNEVNFVFFNVLFFPGNPGQLTNQIISEQIPK